MLNLRTKKWRSHGDSSEGLLTCNTALGRIAFVLQHFVQALWKQTCTCSVFNFPPHSNRGFPVHTYQFMKCLRTS